ncbi:MAG: hypothetical protein IJX39_03845 [Clostridia bacterium]|nr:hypothetical protein [Clostridia bacterium]
MKRKFGMIAVITAITLLLGALLGILIEQKVNPTVEITAWECQGYEDGIVIGRLKVTEYAESPYNGTRFTPKNQEDVQAMIDMSPYYVGTISTHFSFCFSTGWLFYKDNNSYILYYNEDSQTYRLDNINSQCTIDGHPVCFPTFVGTTFSSSLFKQFASYGKNYAQESIYNWFNYDEAKVFYSVYDRDYVSFDDAAQMIFVKGYHVDHATMYSYPNIVLNFAESRLGYKTEAGEIVYFG